MEKFKMVVAKLVSSTNPMFYCRLLPLPNEFYDSRILRTRWFRNVGMKVEYK